MNEAPEAVMEESTEPTQSDVTPEAIVEALLFSSDEPLSAAKIAQIPGIRDRSDIKKHVQSLNERFDEGGPSFPIAQIAQAHPLPTSVSSTPTATVRILRCPIVPSPGRPLRQPAAAPPNSMNPPAQVL